MSHTLKRSFIDFDHNLKEYFVTERIKPAKAGISSEMVVRVFWINEHYRTPSAEVREDDLVQSGTMASILFSSASLRSMLILLLSRGTP